MKHISKGYIFTIFLLIIALFEGHILYNSWCNSKNDYFKLDSKEYILEVQDIQIKRFPFEMHIADKINEIIRETKRSMSQNIINEFSNILANDNDKIIDDNSEKQVADKEQSILVNEEKTAPKARIAIVIDDMGISNKYTEEILQIRAPLTASFLTYNPANQKQAQKAVENGFEAILHVPMMPHIPAALAPITLSPEMPKEEIQKHLSNMFARYPNVDIKGINNHMGSLFTEKEEPMRCVMEYLKAHNLYFLDSKTTGKSVGAKTAKEYSVPYLSRDVFLDNKNDFQYIMRQLKQTEDIALKKGYAIAIGHPHSETVKALNEWIKNLEEKGIILVHLKELILNQ